MSHSNIIYGLDAETAIHAGANASTGAIDLPIMREHHTGYPCIFGSAVKGAIRAKAVQDKQENITTIFGPDTLSAGAHAGSLLVSDARLLLLPVRSLTSQYRWVTSPELIARLVRDAKRLGINMIAADINGALENDQVLVANGKKDQEELFLEEFAFSTKQTDLTSLVSLLSKVSGRDEQEISDKLAIVSNDSFSFLCQSAIPVNPHIAIDNAHKTVKPGALWYEESLPSETILYLAISATASRSGNKMTANDILGELQSAQSGLLKDGSYLQLGGNETTGMGWCKLTAFNGMEG